MGEDSAKALTASFYRRADEPEWDRFVTGSANGGLLHTRRFLDYHGARFNDISLMFRDAQNGGLIGILPLAATDTASAISHPGSSFGGLVTQRPDPLVTAQMFALGAQRLQDAGFQTLTILTHPTIFHRQPDDSAQLFLALAGRITALHLWSVIQLSNRTLVSKKRRLAVQSFHRSGLLIRQSDTPADYRQFYQMLTENLAERHQVQPLHGFDELMDLRARLGTSARLFLASTATGELLAATWIWDYENGVWHSQYICSTAEGRRQDAVDALILHCQETAKAAGQRLYSLGRSTLADGWSVNEGLLKFKKRLGCGLAEQRRIEIDLTELRRVSLSWSEGHRLHRPESE